MDADSFVISNELVELLLKHAGRDIQISPIQVPSFEEEGRSERVREHVNYAIFGLLSIFGHTLKECGGQSICIISSDGTFTTSIINQISENLCLENPYGVAEKAILDKLANEFRDYLNSSQQIKDDWGTLEVQEKAVLFIAPSQAPEEQSIKVELQVQKPQQTREHPYKAYEGSRVWKVVSKGIRDLVKNQDLVLTEDRRYVVGYLCKLLVKRRVAQHSKGIKKAEKKAKKKVKS